MPNWYAWGLGATLIDFITLQMTYVVTPFMLLYFGGTALDLGLLYLASGLASVFGSTICRISQDRFGFPVALLLSTAGSFFGLITMALSTSLITLAIANVILQLFNCTEVLMFPVIQAVSKNQAETTRRLSTLTSIRWLSRIVSPVMSGILARVNIMWPALFGGSLTGAFFFALFVGIVMNYLYERKKIESKGDAEAKKEAPAAVVLTPEQEEHISLRTTWMIAFYCSSYAAMLCGNVPTTLVVAFLGGFAPLKQASSQVRSPSRFTSAERCGQ